MTTVSVTRATGPVSGAPLARLSITGVAAPATRYASNFTLMSMDGWAIVSGTGWLTVDGVDVPYALDLEADGDTVQAGRTVTGLTIGQTYRYSVDVKRNNSGQVTAVVTGLGGTGYITPSTIDYTTLTVDFTATATSHQIKVAIQAAGGTWSADPKMLFRNAKVTGPIGTWNGLRAWRSDDNGTDVPVRNPGNVDTVSGSAILYDYDAALSGPISYTVMDGQDNAATAGVTLGTEDDPTWLHLPARASTSSPYEPPALDLFMVTGWAEEQSSIGRTHQIIGRTDKVGNPGPLALRSGTFDVLGLSYAEVLVLRDLLSEGDVAMLRQPTHSGLDLYFTVNGIRTRPDPDSETWTATVAYEEVPAP